MNAAREQRTVFGEVAALYDQARPSYPDALFDAVLEFAALQPGDRALEIGAGTGIATAGFVARGLDVLALEPSPGMAAFLRTKHARVVQATFERWEPEPGSFALAFAAQSWHWVKGVERCTKIARVLRPGGAIAVFWNRGRPHTEPFRSANDAVYAELAPNMSSSIGTWSVDALVAEFAATGAFEPVVERTITWECSYTRDEWIDLLRTHSDHRILPDDVRRRLHDAVGKVVDAYGGVVDVVYDTMLFMARRARAEAGTSRL